MDPFRAFLLPWKKTGAPPGGLGKVRTLLCSEGLVVSCQQLDGNPTLEDRWG